MSGTTITVEIAGHTLDVFPVDVGDLDVTTQQVVAGRCAVLGWTLANSGASAETVTLGDGGSSIVRGRIPIVVPAAGDSHQWMPHPTAAVAQGLMVDLPADTITGTVWVGIPRGE